ncbi:MAG: VOC family protein [Alphaproteobacteria bacterium]
MEQRLSLVTLGVHDLAASRRFYERLGWHASPRSSEDIVFFQMNGLIFSLYGRDALANDATIDPKSAGVGGSTIAINFRSEAEVDAALEDAEAAGATVLKQPQKVFWGGYSGYFADPDGHLWELAHNPFWEIEEDGSVVLPELD